MGGKPKPAPPSQREVQADRISKGYMDEIENDTSPVDPYDFSSKRGEGRRGRSFSELMGGNRGFTGEIVRAVDPGFYKDDLNMRRGNISGKNHRGVPSISNDRKRMYDNFQGRR